MHGVHFQMVYSDSGLAAAEGAPFRLPTAAVEGVRPQLGWSAPGAAASRCRLRHSNSASSMLVASSMVDHGTSRRNNPSMVRKTPS